LGKPSIGKRKPTVVLLKPPHFWLISAKICQYFKELREKVGNRRVQGALDPYN